MVQRQFWLNRIENRLRQRSVLWLSGVRRVGKTMLCQSIPKIEYFDCELPRVRIQMEDTQSFLEDMKGRTIILDEIHRLSNPSEILVDFDQPEFAHRFLLGGLPPFFLAKNFPERDVQEWMEAYWAKDIQELFRLERRHSFLKFAELLMIQSGGIFEANRFAGPCEVSRSTIANYLSILEATYVVHIVRPFSSHRPTEIVS